MSDRRFDVTVLQILASVLAAVTGAIAVSYFGVAGTIIGTAVMSVVTTAGSAVYKHYLGRTARRLRVAAPVAAAHRAAERMSAGAHAGLYQGGTRAAGSAAAGGADDASGRDRPGAGDRPRPAEHRDRGDPGRHEHGAGAGWLARHAGRLRRWPVWLRVAAASAVVFAVVIGGITVFEVAAGKPLDAVVWHHKGSGTTVGSLVGGQSSRSTAPAAHPTSPGRPSSSPSPSASSPSPSPTPSSGSPSPGQSASPSPTAPAPSPSPTATK